MKYVRIITAVLILFVVGVGQVQAECNPGVNDCVGNNGGH